MRNHTSSVRVSTNQATAFDIHGHDDEEEKEETGGEAPRPCPYTHPDEDGWLPPALVRCENRTGFCEEFKAGTWYVCWCLCLFLCVCMQTLCFMPLSPSVALYLSLSLCVCADASCVCCVLWNVVRMPQ